MAKLIASLVARTPQSASGPVLTEVDNLTFNTLNFVKELNRAGTATLACPIRSLSSASRARLRNLASTPCEVWIYHGTSIEWAGEIRTRAIQGQILTLNCVGLLGYLERMGIVADYVRTATDLFTIVKDLVDAWQNLPYGHYGIDTSGIGLSGVVRDKSYLRQELHQVGQRVQELGATDDGFDLAVDPLTRDLVLAHPQLGADLSATMFVDARNVDSASSSASVAPADLVSDFNGTSSVQGGTGENKALYSSVEESALRMKFGRTWGSQSFSNEPDQTSLDQAGIAYVAPRTDQMFQPGATIVPRQGMDIGDFDAGDTITYSYDAGLGLEDGPGRVAKLTTNVDENGKRTMSVDFA